MEVNKEVVTTTTYTIELDPTDMTILLDIFNRYETALNRLPTGAEEFPQAMEMIRQIRARGDQRYGS